VASATLAPAGASASSHAAPPSAGGMTASPTPVASSTPEPSSKPVPYGVSTAAAPEVTRVDCVVTCPGGAPRGATLRVRGTGDMRKLDTVAFLGVDGPADDVSVSPTIKRKTSVDVVVPLGAVSGQIALVDATGRQSVPSAQPVTITSVLGASLSGTTTSVEATVRAPRMYYDSETPPTLLYLVHGPAAVPVAIQLTRVSDGAVVASWNEDSVAPETLQSVTWDGLAGGKVQSTGEYAFHVVIAGIAGPPQPVAFQFGRDEFPILGPHVFGTGTAAFGGPRGHQGQDTFAACGTPLVAAHGGTVKAAAFQSAAGNYLAVDGEGTGQDYTYMHLREPALVKEGDTVLAGEPIGYVGDTGDADGCHLHFEIWTDPGWYSGGHPIDPLPSLKAWDRRG
jgi:murein DD-endopeptidase MepM/ murein hydrolase activator NlpD